MIPARSLNRSSCRPTSLKIGKTTATNAPVSAATLSCSYKSPPHTSASTFSDAASVPMRCRVSRSARRRARANSGCAQRNGVSRCRSEKSNSFIQPPEFFDLVRRLLVPPRRLIRVPLAAGMDPLPKTRTCEPRECNMCEKSERIRGVSPRWHIPHNGPKRDPWACRYQRGAQRRSCTRRSRVASSCRVTPSAFIDGVRAVSQRASIGSPDSISWGMPWFCVRAARHS